MAALNMTYATLMGPERRRRWSEADRRGIVAAAFAPGAVVTRVARSYDVSTALIYKWRKEGLGEQSRALFAPVVVTDEPDGPATADLSGAVSGTAIVVELAGGGRVTIGGAASPALAAAVLGALGR
jgi:transposase